MKLQLWKPLNKGNAPKILDMPEHGNFTVNLKFY